MPDTQIRYDLLMQDAMRGVIKAVLTQVAENGLPGEHHFYIVFDTKAEGVNISPVIQAQYPEEMTIVLQHQFWGLQVSDKRFEVQLSFNNKVERLDVPFTAIKGFVDPSVSYGFHIGGPETQKNGDHLNLLVPAEGLNDQDDSPVPETVQIGAQSPDIAALNPVEKLPSNATASDLGHQGDDTEKEEEVSAEIVELDHFRKK